MALDLTGLTSKQQEERVQEKAIVAFSGTRDNDVAILWCTPGLRADIRESALSDADVFGHNGESGIQVWEGFIVGITYPSTPNGPEEYDVEYQGVWRPPTEAEWRSMQEGRDPCDPSATCSVDTGKIYIIRRKTDGLFYKGAPVRGGYKRPRSPWTPDAREAKHYGSEVLAGLALQTGPHFGTSGDCEVATFIFYEAVD